MDIFHHLNFEHWIVHFSQELAQSIANLSRALSTTALKVCFDGLHRKIIQTINFSVHGKSFPS